MKRKVVRFMGVRAEALHCRKCRADVFTEEQTHKVVVAIEAKKLKKEYVKRPIKIGGSLGLTFPNAVASAFNLKSKKLKIHPNLAKGSIEIAVE